MFFSVQDWILNEFLEKGLSADKLLLGLATYGRSFTLTDPQAKDIGDLGAYGEMGEMTQEEGMLSLFEVTVA